jgi:hypothetical protein
MVEHIVEEKKNLRFVNTGFRPVIVWYCPNQDMDFHWHISWLFFVLNDLKWEIDLLVLVEFHNYQYKILLQYTGSNTNRLPLCHNYCLIDWLLLNVQWAVIQLYSGRELIKQYVPCFYIAFAIIYHPCTCIIHHIISRLLFFGIYKRGI